MNDSREQTLSRIRQSLSTPSAHQSAVPSSASAPELLPITECLPAVGASVEERIASFAKNAKELAADFRLLESQEAAHAELRALAQANGWKRVATHGGPLTEAACAALTDVLEKPVLRTDNAYAVADLEACDAGISTCEALIAQTGSTLITSRSSSGRALSVLPPHHIVLARREQLITDLPEAFALLKSRYSANGDNYPSMISFITGPSRTGDIERILVLGAHGPKKLTILCF